MSNRRQNRIGEMDPYSIRFTQSNAGFDGFASQCENLLNGGSIQPIRVYRRNGEWHSLDNRRLAAYQFLGESSIPYQRVYLSHPNGHGGGTIANEARWKRSTRNGGQSIRLRGAGDLWSPSWW